MARVDFFTITVHMLFHARCIDKIGQTFIARGIEMHRFKISLFMFLLLNMLSGVGLAQVDETLLVTGRAISPAGKVLEFYGRPVDIQLSHDQKLLFVKDRSALRVIDAATFELIDSIEAAGGASLFGLDIDREGRVYFSNANNQVHVYEFGDDRKLKLIHSIPVSEDSFPCGLCLSADEKQMYVCLSKKNSLAIVDLEKKEIVKEIPVGVAPFDVVLAEGNAFVSNIGGRRARAEDKTAPSAGTETVVDQRGIASTGTISVVSLAEQSAVAEIAVGLHPSVLIDAGNHVLVCNTNQDSISQIRIADKKVTTFNVKPDEKLPFGSMPSCLCWLSDKKHLLVSLAGNNAITVLAKKEDGTFETVGQIPTAWFPAGLACNDEYVYVANVKGYGSRSQRRDPEQGRNSHDHQGVVQQIPISEILNTDTLNAWTKKVAENSKLAQIVRNRVLEETTEDIPAKPIPDKLGQPSVLKHVIYVIKENRTFDQLFGDYEEARSEPKLCIFPREITPNHHALADRFGILDNYYCNGILSADGHSWATEGNVTPYLERAFGGFGRSYTFGDDPITYSSSGFIWDHILAAGLSFRNYGEMDYAKPPGDMKYHEIYDKYVAGEKIVFEQNIGIERLRSYSCRDYPGWNMDIPDVLRMDRFLEEFRTYEKEGTLPNFCIVYLPEDHLGAPNVTSVAHMADNDLAVGRLVEAISHSKYWKDTVIFINEDDPQNGYDHIDGHRSICLVISPYSKKGVNHGFYNQTSVIRTMLHIFGIPPMNQQDASANLMDGCFQTVGDFSAYDAIVPITPLNQKPDKEANWSPSERRWREILKTVPIERTGMKTEKDEDNLNRFVWHDVMGWETPYPVEYSGPHGKGLKSLGLIIDPNDDDD
jgi:DNA-binding beta-propeller fold protein YncE/phospholipase C